jgi:hypothetical protein
METLYQLHAFSVLMKARLWIVTTPISTMPILARRIGLIIFARTHAIIYREIAERTEDAFIKNELLDLASVCEEAADNIEDHQTQTRH